MIRVALFDKALDETPREVREFDSMEDFIEWTATQDRLAFEFVGAV